MLFLLDKMHHKERPKHYFGTKRHEMEPAEMSRIGVATKRERSTSVPKLPRFQKYVTDTGRRTSYASAETDFSFDFHLSPDSVNDSIVIRSIPDQSTGNWKILEHRPRKFSMDAGNGYSFVHLGTAQFDVFIKSKGGRVIKLPAFSNDDLEWDRFHDEMTMRKNSKESVPRIRKVS